MHFQQVTEEIHLMGSTLVERIKELIHEGNVQRIIIKNEQGHRVQLSGVPQTRPACLTEPVFGGLLYLRQDAAHAAFTGLFSLRRLYIGDQNVDH